MAKVHLPRILLAAPKSGSGKTLISCGLLETFRQAGEDIRAYKCGPDYIDPMFHRRVIGIPSENIDTVFARPDQIREQLTAGGKLALIEGVMGIYDGVGGTERKGSAYDVAQITDSPIVLVMDVRGMGVTMLSVLKGILADDPDHRIRGVIFNRISKGFYERMEPLVSGLGIEALGFLPAIKDVGLESRHLGLKQPEEIESLNEQIRRLADSLRENVHMDVLRKIMESAPDIEKPEQAAEAYPGISPEKPSEGLVLAVARDAAFSFYYEANLRAFRERGVIVKEFSPLKDPVLPEDACGLLLGGGYPELYCRELSENEKMRSAVRRAIESGMPSLAECGGFMYLHESLTGQDGNCFPMAGVIPGGSRNTGKLCRFGYVELMKKEQESEGSEKLLLETGETIKGHEFHYYDSESNGEDCIAAKIGTGRSWDCGFLGKNHLWGFAHLYYPSSDTFLDRFIEEMRRFRDRKGAEGLQKILQDN